MQPYHHESSRCSVEKNESYRRNISTAVGKPITKLSRRQSEPGATYSSQASIRSMLTCRGGDKQLGLTLWLVITFDVQLTSLDCLRSATSGQAMVFPSRPRY
ncbi:unnamed protein product, partial [Laminaria digitata]